MWLLGHFKVFCIVVTFRVVFTQKVRYMPWQYECVDDLHHDVLPRCHKLPDHKPNGMGLAECKLTCGTGTLFNNLTKTLWPRPRRGQYSKSVTAFNPRDVTLSFRGGDYADKVKKWLHQTVDERTEWLIAENVQNKSTRSAASVQIIFAMTEPVNTKITRDTDESYKLSVSPNVRGEEVEISSHNFFGARHALETLFQLMTYDDLRQEYIMVSYTAIEDSPVFHHRGVLVDTARNFISVEVLQRIIQGMSFNKLNVLHWHITDSQSFPIQLEKYSDTTAYMAQSGASGANQIYTVSQIKKLVEFASSRGVRIVPELDSPGHAGNGWQFPGAKDLSVCFDVPNSINEYNCAPPCGQLNPMSEDMYAVLGQIYDELYDLFDFDSFHMGGDEVRIKCWNTSEAVTKPMLANGSSLTTDDFIELWAGFHHRGSQMLKEVSKNEDLEVILWTSTLTNEKYLHHLPKHNYTIQIWSMADDPNDDQIEVIAKSGHKMIFSNADALYMDCGYAMWRKEGLNWCAPYKGWQVIYGNDLYKILSEHGVQLSQHVIDNVLGAEIAMWTESASSESIESKLFPRAAAFAERMWTNPGEHDTSHTAEGRLVQHRFKSVHRGIRADAIQPEWCRQNEGKCYPPKLH